MQNDFIDGSLGTAEAQAIVEGVAAKIREYEVGNVYATRDTHYADYLNTMEGKKLPVEHCIEGTEGWKLRAEIEQAMREKETVVVGKPTFGSYELVQQLMYRYLDEPCEFEFVGLCTDICVVSNVLLLKAALPDAVIRVDANCCAGVTPESHEAALTTMKMCHIDVV